MTYMYEYPEYIKVPMNATVQKNFPKYSLFVYGEGSYANYLKEMNSDYKLTGIPVVFVHGNAGRYKQVRIFYIDVQNTFCSSEQFLNNLKCSYFLNKDLKCFPSKIILTKVFYFIVRNVPFNISLKCSEH